MYTVYSATCIYCWLSNWYMYTVDSTTGIYCWFTTKLAHETRMNVIKMHYHIYHLRRYAAIPYISHHILTLMNILNGCWICDCSYNIKHKSVIHFKFVISRPNLLLINSDIFLHQLGCVWIHRLNMGIFHSTSQSDNSLGVCSQFDVILWAQKIIFVTFVFVDGITHCHNLTEGMWFMLRSLDLSV